jgi:hypothetical protein
MFKCVSMITSSTDQSIQLVNGVCVSNGERVVVVVVGVDEDAELTHG